MEKNAAGTTQAAYVNQGPSMYDPLLYMDRGGTKSYHLFNHLGTTLASASAGSSHGACRWGGACIGERICQGSGGSGAAPREGHRRGAGLRRTIGLIHWTLRGRSSGGCCAHHCRSQRWMTLMLWAQSAPSGLSQDSKASPDRTLRGAQRSQLRVTRAHSSNSLTKEVISSLTVTILSTLQALAPAKAKPFSKSPCSALTSASAMQ